MRFWVGWLSDGQSLESPVDKKSCLKSGFQERRLRLAPRREEGAGGKWRELVVGLAAAAQTEGGGARAARACVRTCVRARLPHSAHRVPAAPVSTLDSRGRRRQPIPPPLLPDKVPASFQPGGFGTAEVLPPRLRPRGGRPTGSSSAPTVCGKPPGPRRRSAAQAELWEGSRSGGRSLKMAEAGVNWGSPGRAQVSCFGGGRLEDAGGFRAEESGLGLDVAGWIRLLAGVGGESRTCRWGLLGEGSRLHLRAGSARARRKQRAHGGAGFRGCRGPRTVGDLAEWKAAGGRRKGRPRRSVWGQRWASCLVYTLTGLGCLGGLGGRPGLVRERGRH